MSSKLDGHTPASVCHCCLSNLSTVLTCSRCKNATYCSKECQRKHWKDHKPRCELYQQSKAQSTNKREFRLLQQFRDAARSEGLAMALVKAFPDRAVFLKQPSRAVVVLEVKFDYNYQSFVPVKPAEFVHDRSLLPASLQQFEPSYVAPDAEYVQHLLLLMHEGKFIAMPTRITVEAWKWNREMTWEDINNMCRLVKLQSSVFDSFHPGANVKAQLSKIQGLSDFSQFLASALAMNSTKPLHKEKVVVIELELGFGLGEIEQLSSWYLETVPCILKKMAKFTPPPQLERVRTVELNLNSSPYLARANPGSSYCPVLFCHPKTGLYFVLPNAFVFTPSLPPSSKAECRAAAQRYFQRIAAVELPPVQSPPID